MIQRCRVNIGSDSFSHLFPYVLLAEEDSFPGEVIKGDSIFHTNVTSKHIYKEKKKRKCLNKGESRKFLFYFMNTNIEYISKIVYVPHKKDQNKVLFKLRKWKHGSSLKYQGDINHYLLQDFNGCMMVSKD